MASFGRSCEKLAASIATLAEGVNQRLDENHLVDMIVTLKDEEISVGEFEEFTETVRQLRGGKRSSSSSSSGTSTTNV